MSLYNAPMGMNTVFNPLVDSPYSQQGSIGIPYPPIGAEYLDTEGGVHILTESGKNITTE